MLVVSLSSDYVPLTIMKSASLSSAPEFYWLSNRSTYLTSIERIHAQALARSQFCFSVFLLIMTNGVMCTVDLDCLLRDIAS